MHQTRLLLYIITGLLLLLLPRLLPAEEGWRKAAEGADKKIVVYTRSVEGSPLKAFRGVTRVKATLGSLINLVKDVDAFPEWMYNAKSAKVLVQISDTERFVYTTQKSPWPVTDRDMVVYSKLEQDPDTRQVTINLEARPREYPEQEGYVRVPAMIGKWQFTPIGDGFVEIVFEARVNPGGRIPNMLANAFVIDNPLETLSGLKEMIQKPKYRDAGDNLIIEP